MPGDSAGGQQRAQGSPWVCVVMAGSSRGKPGWGTGPGLRGHPSWEPPACVPLMASERERPQGRSVGKDQPRGEGAAGIAGRRPPASEPPAQALKGHRRREGPELHHVTCMWPSPRSWDPDR